MIERTLCGQASINEKGRRQADPAPTLHSSSKPLNIGDARTVVVITGKSTSTNAACCA
jgi:hypothetical protein